MDWTLDTFYQKMSVFTCFSNLPHTDQHHCTVSLDVGEAFCKSTNLCAAEARQKHVVFRTKPTSNKKTDTAFFTIISSANQMSESSESNSLAQSGDGPFVVPVGSDPVRITLRSSTGGGSKGEKKNDLVVVRSRETVQQYESQDEQDESSPSKNVEGDSLRHRHNIAQPTCADIVVGPMSAPTTRTVATINVKILSTTNENTVPNVS